MRSVRALLHWRTSAFGGEGGVMRSRRSRPRSAIPSSAFVGFRFPPEIIDVLVSVRRDLRAARRFCATALRVHGEPVEVVTDRAPALRAAIEGLMPAAFHNTTQYANNRVECDQRRLKARLRPMRGLKRDHSARVIIRGHALMQNIRRGHYELGVDARHHRRIETAFTELAQTI